MDLRGGDETEEDDDEETSRRAIHPRLSTEARQEGFPAEGIFSSGAQGHPTYESSNGGQVDDDDGGGSEDPANESGGTREGSAAGGGEESAGDGAGGNHDRSYLTQRPGEEDGWMTGSSSELGPPLTGGVGGGGDVDVDDDDVCRMSQSPPLQVAAAAAAAAAGEAFAAEDEEEAESHEAVLAPSSNGMVWDAAAATAGGGVSEGGGSRFSHSGRGSVGGGGGGSGSRRRGEDMMFRREDGGGDGSEGDGSPLIAPSDIMRHMPAAMSGRDREAQAVIDALQEVYRKSLKPIEELSFFGKFHHDVMTDADLQAKPQVLLLGQHSTGKTSMIKHFIGRDFPGMHIGPEAAPGVFQVVTAGTAERTVKGSALCILDELPYAGLGKFGAPFLGKFQASIVPSPILDHMNFVDTPGILAADRHGARGYPFPEVVKWFADRSDLILLVFDAHKLDMGEEFREVVSAIAQHGDRVRVVLNKAQEVDSDRLLKVYGALMWSIGRCLGGGSRAGSGAISVPKVYVGSFWDGPRRHPDDRREDDDNSFELDEADLRREMMELPKNVGVRKINDLMQRAKLVKIHLQIIYAVRARMPRIWGAEAAQDRILASLEEVFEEVQAKNDIHPADMPDVEEYRRDLGRIDFRDLPRRNRRLLATLDDIVERDIKQCITRAGGVRRIYKLDSAAKIVDDFAPSASGSSRRRATMGGTGRDGDRRLGVAGGGGLFDGRRRLSGIAGISGIGSGIVDADVSTESSGSSDSVVDDDSVMGGAKGGREEEERVPIVLGSFVMVMVVLVGICVALWKMDALPLSTATTKWTKWAESLKPKGLSS